MGALELLSLAEQILPTTNPAVHHTLHAEDGKLVLRLWRGNRWDTFVLGTADLAKSPAQVLDEAAVMMSAQAEDDRR